jgi:hypothetical protein
MMARKRELVSERERLLRTSMTAKEVCVVPHFGFCDISHFADNHGFVGVVECPK